MAKRMTKKQREQRRRIQITVAVVVLILAVLLAIFAPDVLKDALGITTTTTPPPYEIPFDLSTVDPFTGQLWEEINFNRPFFEDNEITDKSYEYYSPLDSLGRCGYAMACIGKDLMPDEDRKGLNTKPSGWVQANYECVSSKHLYERCHLIGFQLTGENDNELNLITGTRFLNVESMLEWENKVAKYVKETGNHVMYRVTPIYEGNNLVASGVLMEGYSVEDNGEGISFCVYAHNAQPHIVINYLTGESYHDSNVECDKYQ